MLSCSSNSVVSMKNLTPNHYKRAFSNWLDENHIHHIAMDQEKRAAFGKSKIKTFDYLLYPPNQQIFVAELKGRKFRGTTFEKLKGLQCWVTMDDVSSLTNWQKVFGPTHTCIFVFSYKIEKADVDYDGREIHRFQNNKYTFFAVKLSDYCKYMKQRSPKWQTVSLSAKDFRNSAVQMQNLIA